MKNKEEVFDTLKQLLQFYDCYRRLMDMSHKDAVEKTLEVYHDFFEWITERVDEG